MMHHLGDGKHVIRRRRVQGSVIAVSAVRNTSVFPMETRLVADEYWTIHFGIIY